MFNLGLVSPTDCGVDADDVGTDVNVDADVDAAVDVDVDVGGAGAGDVGADVDTGVVCSEEAVDDAVAGAFWLTIVVGVVTVDWIGSVFALSRAQRCSSSATAAMTSLTVVLKTGL